MPDRDTIESIFLAAVELPPDQRQSFLDQRCGDDPVLIAEVKKLLDADQQAGAGKFLRSGFLGSGLFDRDASDAAAKAVAETSGDAGRFRLIRSFREGGLGEVLIAHDRQLDRDVAVKQIKPRWKESDEARQRFIQEAKVTGRLEHPGIVPVYAMGTWPDGQHYYAMRFIEGDTMKDVIDRYHTADDLMHSGQPTKSDDAKRLQLRELLSRFVDVCHTIEYAHSKRVLHRDIKPSNIMVGPYGETLVVDWGLAKLLDEPAEESMTADLARAKMARALDQQLAAGKAPGSGSTPTQVGGTVGTPNYMSPEQAKGKLDEIGTRTDVYLLGATLYHVLTGKPPHCEDSISKLLKQVSLGTLTPPRDLNSDVSPALESICLKAMATEPADRYADPRQIADDVNRWMADQPVSVHNDNAYVRLNRWMRRHRTATSTIAVATLLLLVGGVLGSILWNVAKVKEFQAEEAQRSKQLELEIKDRQRIAELAIAASAAEDLAQKEITRNRFSSALDVLQNTLASIESEPKLADQVQRIADKVDRVGSLVEFYSLADVVEQQNVLSRDTKALSACTMALKELGVWEQPDWWTALPDEDLSPEQTDTLRWDVYQQLMLMDAMLVKTMFSRLAGDGGIGGWSTLFRIGRRLINTDAGKFEAEAALVVADRIDRFRLSESTRLYRSFAQWRFELGSWLRGQDLGAATNSADAHSLAVLCTIASVDPNFAKVFSGYQGDDPLMAARDTYGRSAVLRPKYYGAHLGLGQIEYLIATRKEDLKWEDLVPSLRAFSQCITLLPDRCFAHVDRSSIYRVQARLIAEDERYSGPERQQRIAECLKWSLADAERAMQFYNEHPWVGWQVGHTYADLGQVRRAIELWIQTAIDTYPLGETADKTFVGIDDVRGRGEIGTWLKSQLDQTSSSVPIDRAKAFLALAGVRLNQARNDDALEAVESALAIDPDDANARAFRGMILMRTMAFETAMLDFQVVFDQQPDHPFAAFGLARCLEERGEFANAYAMYESAAKVSLSDENQAAAALGCCRTAALMGQYAKADQAIRHAIAVEPACDVVATAYSLTAALVQRRKAQQSDSAQIQALADFIASTSQLPRATRIEPMPPADPDRPAAASILNGDFELGSMKYWSAATGAAWDSVDAGQSSATVTDGEAHSGSASLRIDAELSAGGGTVLGSTVISSTVLGSTGQVFSLVAGQRYELACWVRAESVSPAAFRIVGPMDQVMIEIGDGTYTWRRVTAELIVNQDDQGRPLEPGVIVPFRLQLIAAGSGTIWLDDLSCVSQP